MAAPPIRDRPEGSREQPPKEYLLRLLAKMLTSVIYDVQDQLGYYRILRFLQQGNPAGRPRHRDSDPA